MLYGIRNRGHTLFEAINTFLLYAINYPIIRIYDIRNLRLYDYTLQEELNIRQYTGDDQFHYGRLVFETLISQKRPE